VNLLSVIVAFIVSPIAGVQPGGPVVTISQFQNGATVNVPLGAIVEVQLQANPSTGFGWRMTGNNDSILRPSGSPRFDSFAPGTPGAMGNQVFRFRARSYGGDCLTFSYGANYPGVPPAQSFTCTVIVNGPGGEVVVVTEANNNGTVLLQVGDILIVRLRSSPSAGYQWIANPIVPGVVQRLSVSQLPNNATQIGQKGTQAFGFRVIGSGQAFLSFSYTGPSSTASRNFEVLVRATQAQQPYFDGGRH